MKYLKWIAGILLLLVLAYLLGPSANKPMINASPLLFITPANLSHLETEINAKEKKEAHLKPGNNAHILWADSSKKEKTPYSIVYLHGFSASHAEGFPTHQHLAKRYGCNLYLSRLYAHGLDEKEPLLDLTAEKLVESARSAIAIGKQLGNKVIVISSSTGSTLSLILAAEDKDIAALVMYSPNIDLCDNKSFLLTNPWGLQIARTVIGDKYYTFEAPPEALQYWNTKYRIEAIVQLKSLINATMKKETFKKIDQPVFVGYYYKDERHQDNVVSIPRMKEMFEQVSTPVSKKRMVNFPEAGYHVIGSSYWNKNTQPVEDATSKFLEEVLLLRSVK
jgi:pimeloyl-ACP methyl ester carboxylesterase